MTFDGGTLRLGASFALATTRAITLNGGGGVVEHKFVLYHHADITGAGGPTHQDGDGTLTLVGDNSYAGTTTVRTASMRQRLGRIEPLHRQADGRLGAQGR